MILRLAIVSLVACNNDAVSTPDAPPTEVAPAEAAPADAGLTDAVTAAAAPETEDAKVLYALGRSVGMSLDPFHLTADEVAQLKLGLDDHVAGKPSAVALETYGPKIREFGMARAGKAAEGNAVASKAFLSKLAETPGATVSPSGIVYIETQAGTGKSPKPTDTVTVHYRGTLADGKEFDSSYGRGEPAKFPLFQVIPCWTEGMQKLKIGGKAKIGCPANLAYGDEGSGGTIPPGAALLFEVELVGIGA